MPDSNRRDFVRSAALGVALSAPVVLLADDEKPKDKEKVETSKPPTEAEARMSYVLARFGVHLDEAARKSVRAEIDGLVGRAEALRKIPLDNGDGPFPVFRPYRAPLT